MSAFSNLTLDRFLDALASARPTPGGGTAAAVAGAIGVALLVMVTGLTRSRHGTQDDRAALDAAGARLAPLRQALQAAADRDAVAFDAVMAAIRLPKGTDAEKAARTARVQAAYREAAEVPLETLRLITRALEDAAAVAAHGNPSAATDVAVAVTLLSAAAEGAAENVRINLEGLTDHPYRSSTDGEATNLLARVSAAARQARTALSPG
jgi:formiminotetrahydrofolate cyclodeaminase